MGWRLLGILVQWEGRQVSGNQPLSTFPNVNSAWNTGYSSSVMRKQIYAQYHAEVYSTPHVISATQTCYITLWNRVRIVAKDSSDVDSIDNAFFFFFTRLQSVSLPVARILKWDVASVGRCICRENILRNRLFKNIYIFLSITAFLLLLLLRGLLSQNH